MSNRHKQVHCPVCYRSIRSDNQKRHARTHKHILARPEYEWREELKDLLAANKELEAKFHRLEEIARQEEIPTVLLKDVIPSNTEVLNDDDIWNIICFKTIKNISIPLKWVENKQYYK